MSDPNPSLGWDGVALHSAPAGGAELDLSEEQRLVEQICAGGGVRPAPSREELATFVDCAGRQSVRTHGSTPLHPAPNL